MAIKNYTTWFIALVWLVNGLFCKVLNFVPRHQEIVARILGSEHSELLTKCIGLSEILMAGWVLSQYRKRLSAIATITLVVVMNIIEFTLAPDLLLFGKFNALVALVFVALVYLNEFKPNDNLGV